MEKSAACQALAMGALSPTLHALAWTHALHALIAPPPPAAGGGRDRCIVLATSKDII